MFLILNSMNPYIYPYTWLHISVNIKVHNNNLFSTSIFFMFLLCPGQLYLSIQFNIWKHFLKYQSFLCVLFIFLIDKSDNKRRTKISNANFFLIFRAPTTLKSEGEVTSLSGADKREVRDNREKWWEYREKSKYFYI